MHAFVEEEGQCACVEYEPPFSFSFLHFCPKKNDGGSELDSWALGNALFQLQFRQNTLLWHRLLNTSYIF